METKLSSRDQILSAARSEFIKKGFNGARMQEIANVAGINKGLLHYYFKSKDVIFNAVFEDAFLELVPKHNSLHETNTSLFQKIERFVDEYMSVLDKSPELASFVLHEMNQNPDRAASMFTNENHPAKFYKEVGHRVATGAINSVDPKQLYIHMISLCIFPFIGGPLARASMDMPKEEYNQLLKRRKKEVAQFIINAIRR